MNMQVADRHTPRGATSTLLKQNMILLPFAIDPHGRWGPITENFLNLLDRDLDYTFPAHRPNTATMFMKSTHPCPIGILRTADELWKPFEDTTIFRTILHSPDSIDLHHTTNGTWNH